MKIKLKTQFWENEDTEKWRQKYEKTIFSIGILNLCTMAALILNQEKVALIAASIQFTITVLITITYNSYKKRKRKEAENGETDKKELPENSINNKNTLPNIQENIRESSNTSTDRRPSKILQETKP